MFYRTSSPLGPLPCTLSLTETIIQSRAMGIADHILPLGDLLVVFGLCYRPNDPVTSITAPAYPHKTGVAVDPALFVFVIC